MKRFLNGKMRMLSLLLSLVLVVGLMPLVAVRASAAGNSFSYAYDCSRTPDWPQKGSSFTAGSIEKPYNNSQTQIDPSGTWDLTSKGYWTSDMSSTLGANRIFLIL